jgi:hypothetical protein
MRSSEFRHNKCYQRRESAHGVMRTRGPCMRSAIEFMQVMDGQEPVNRNRLVPYPM